MLISFSLPHSKSCVYFNMHSDSEDAGETAILNGKFNGNGPKQVREFLIGLLSDP